MQKQEIPSLKESFKHFKRLFFLIRPYWGKLTKGMSFGLISGILGMATPFLTKLLIDKVYPTEDVSLMHVLVGGILALSITLAVIGVIQGYYNLYINSKLSNSTSLMFFNHLQHLKVRFFDEHQVGEIMSRFKDVGSSLGAVNKVLQTVLVNGVYLIIVPPFLFLLHWKLAIVSLISIPLTVILISLSGKILRKYWKKTSEAFADLNAFQVEMLTNVRALKSMVLERFVFEKAHNKINNAINMQLKAGGLGQIVGLSNGIIRALNTALFTYLGWTFILTKEMTLGDYIAFSSYIGYLYNPISQFVGLFSEFQQSAVNLNRMYEYLDSPTEQDPQNAFEKYPDIHHRISGNILVKDIYFGYSDDKYVLNNVNLEINKGTVTSIIGPSGSGKTSLLRLLVGMETAQSGTVLYDGRPVNTFDIHELRRQVTVIWQEFSMFKGSILENLTLGLDDYNMEDVIYATKLSRMYEHINSLPEKFETPIGEWGTTLSGGQRQRLAIARAVIRNTPIIIFDEATSNIDIKTENEILRELFKKDPDKTVIFVTHRTSTAKLADKICVLDDNKIIDSGTHFELLERCEKYVEMVDPENKNDDILLKTFKQN